MSANWDKGLTPLQKRAASHIGSHARLLAGPGTGKSLTLTRRVLWLMSEQRVKPSEILALTFTRAAAAELKRSIEESLAATTAFLPRISTLHAFALRQLLRNASLTHLPQPTRIADDYEERWIILEELKQVLGRNVRQLRNLLEELSADWQRLTPDWEERFPDARFLGAWREHRDVYAYTLRSELVYQLKRALEEQPQNVRLEGPPKYVIIDEFQDLNACDLAVVRSMADLGSEICCAGDDDQSIYGFRFANPDGIRRFVDDYRPCADISLDICHRCREAILKYGLWVAEGDPRRTAKPISCKHYAERGHVHVLRFADQVQEAEGIAQLCTWLATQKHLAPDDILILLRSDRYRRFSDPIKHALSETGIPVATLSNPLEPLDERPGRELLCLMRLAANRRDHLSWRTVLTLGPRGIGAASFSKLYKMARREGSTFSECLRNVKGNPALLGGTGEAIAKRVSAIDYILDEFGVPQEGSVEEWIAELAARIIEDENQRHEILRVFSRVSGASGEQSLEGLLRVLNVSLGNAEQEREMGKVAVMTMHQAKGLSADAVILGAAEDEYIPGRARGDAIDDERRLLYVSLTRARAFLFVTFCNRRTGPQRHSGRESGQLARTFTRFLSGGPHTPVDGAKFVSTL